MSTLVHPIVGDRGVPSGPGDSAIDAWPQIERASIDALGALVHSSVVVARASATPSQRRFLRVDEFGSAVRTHRKPALD